MSIQSQIERISAAKAALKTAINSRGGTLTDELLGDYASAVTALPSGGGSDTSDATAVAGDILDGKTAYVSGGKVSGTIPTASAATYTPTTSNQIISAGVYLGGSQTILGDANLSAENIKSGASIFGVSGTYSGTDPSDATAVAGDILDGKTAYVSGGKVSGTIPVLSGGTMTPTSSAQVISAGVYLGGDITIPAVSAGAEVTLGYISSGLFQPLTFSGTTAYDGGSAVSGLSCYEWNLPGGGVSSGLVISGGTETVSSGWWYVETTISSGGTLQVLSGGIATSSLIDGGTLVVSGGGSAGIVTAVRGDLYVKGSASGISLPSSGGPAYVIVSSGAAITGTTNYNIVGNIVVYSGGTANSTTVEEGSIFVQDGGTANSTTVDAGGNMTVSSGGSADFVTVSSGGHLTIYSGAAVTNLTSASGAVIINS